MSKPNIWIFCLEPIDSRYTAQWHSHIPKLLEQAAGNNFNVRQIDGVQRTAKVTNGAFLNFSDTNYWKSSQLCNFVELLDSGEVTSNDKFLFTDTWNPCITQVAYMRDLLGMNWELHGIWHAGAYDPSDILGYKMQKPWPYNAERSWFYNCDYNYFATEFHRSMFLKNLDIPEADHGRAVLSGQPYEYLNDLISPYDASYKLSKIIWPHRYNADKQPEIIEDLGRSMKTVITQKLNLSKTEYYETLGKCTINFSCSLHENLGVSVIEGVLAGVIPVVPDRCSYSEMYLDDFKYPSKWTESYESYNKYRLELMEFINDRINNRDDYADALAKQKQILLDNFITARVMIDNLCRITK